MKRSFFKRLSVAGVLTAGASLCLGGQVRAQNASPQARISEAVQDDKVVTLHGNVHPMARAANDRGLLPEQQPITRMQLLLRRSAAQESALQQLMGQQLDPSSPKFHVWLTPQQFGEQFGPADSDLQTVKDWLRSQGFSGLKVNNGKTLIEFAGTAGAVRNSFHAEVHRLSVQGEEHFANMQDPQVPAALASLVGGIAGLHNFRPKPMLHRLGKFRRNAATGEITPLFTFTDVNGTFFGVGPKDFATIYNVPAAFDGTGQTIAVVAQSNINLQDARDFRSIFGLPANDPQIILNGADPGLVSGDEGESDLDVQWAGAVAPNAKIILVATQFTNTDGLGGVDSSAEYIVDNNLAGVLSESYGACESGLGTNLNAYYNALWQQAAAQGITVVVSAGDNGSAGCSDANSESFSGQNANLTPGIAVSGIASTPFNIAMGGTDFNQAGQETTYWNATNGTGEGSAKGYIPEMVWNDSCAASGSTGCSSVSSASPPTCPSCIVAGSGGPSTIYAKPSYQATTITGVPNDTKRDLPDVSLFSGDGTNNSFYIVCGSDQDIPGDTGCNLTNFSSEAGGPFHDFQAVGGTSAAAPTFAGIMALINQKTGQRQGNANPTLYAIAKTEVFANCDAGDSAASSACVFHDITGAKSSNGNTPTKNNSVPCSGGSTNCSKTSTGGFGVLTSAGNPAFTAGVGYDLATGLGSVNVTNLLNSWATPGLISTSVSLAPAAISGTVGSTFTLSGAVTKSSGTGTPSGVVVFENAVTNSPAGNVPAVNISVGSIAADPAQISSSGTYNVNTAFLPAGAYTLKAHYGGDTTFAPSDSPSISVNLAKQDSQVLVSFVNAAGNLVTGTQSVQYGSSYILRVDVKNAGGAACQNVSTGAVAFICPTGTVNLLDNGQPLKDFPNAQTPNASSTARLNDRGFIEDQPIQLTVSTHLIAATYTADASSSYNSQASSNSLSVTITQATTTAAVTSSLSSIASGGMVTLTATVSSNSNSAVGPTGTVQFLNGGSNLGAAATCTPAGATDTTAASCTAKLTTALSSLPPGSMDTRPPSAPLVLLELLACAIAMIALMLAVMLRAKRRQYAYAGAAFFLIAAAVLAGCGGGSSSGGGGGGDSARSITVKYSGDTNYAASTSSAITVTIQ